MSSLVMSRPSTVAHTLGPAALGLSAAPLHAAATAAMATSTYRERPRPNTGWLMAVQFTRIPRHVVIAARAGFVYRRPMRQALIGLALISIAQTGRGPAPAPPACTTATPTCTEWVTLGGGPARSMIYRTYSCLLYTSPSPRDS